MYLLRVVSFVTLDRCDFYKARQTFFTTTHCMIGQKGSPLVPAINHRFDSYLRGLQDLKH